MLQPTANPRSEESAAHPAPMPELLAPAGDWDCAKAAVENGADAIYFGVEKFNARMRARNFTEADLPRLMDFLHRRGARGYVTLNTLVFEDELPEAERCLRTMIAAGVDAVIVQDAGVCRLIRALSPDFPIHASTQMTITSAAGVAFARELDCQLVVLARECSIAEIERMCRVTGGEDRESPDESAPTCSSPATPPHEPGGADLPVGPDARPACRQAWPHIPAKVQGFNARHFSENSHPSLPLEVFVHGALCVAYSGQCLTSEALGGRSANRGECAQACRMPYELIADGRPVPLGDRKYLLSPRDLAGLELLPQLVRAGIASLKIEGRLKTAEYVANITRIYRHALDDLRLTTDDLRPPGASARQSSIVNRQYEMEMSFSRGLYTGWLGGTNNQALVHGRFGKKRGVFLGAVQQVLRDAVAVRLEGPLKPGDGVVFDAGRPEEKEEGGRVYEIRHPTSEIRNAELRFGRGDIDFSRVHVGDKLWKTDDPELNRRLRRTFQGDSPKFQRPVEMEVHGVAGGPLVLVVRDELGNVGKVESARPLARAEKQPLTEAKLRAQLGRLGGTPFALGALKNFLVGEVMLPVSELNRLRREVMAELEELRARPKRWTLRAGGAGLRQETGRRSEIRRDACPRRQAEVDPRDAGATLIVLVRSLPQLEAALECGVTTVYCEFEDLKKYRDAVTLVRTAPGCQAASGRRQAAIFVAPPRVFKTGEDWTLEQVRSCNADGYLIRNYDHLKFFAHDRRVGDFSLNVANRLAADYFKNRFGLERLTASYDLNFQQLEALLRAAPPEWFEVTVHQHIPMFHMEHCVFCAFLSTGTDYRNCGRPCDRHEVKLRDRVGAEHPVKADAGCRNTVFNALAQTGAEYVPRMLALGVRHFRVEFLNEPPGQVGRTIAEYRRLLRGEITGAQLWRELKLLNQLGVTRGQMGK